MIYSWKDHYELELQRRSEINENLKHTFQLSLALISSIAFISLRSVDFKIMNSVYLLNYLIWISLISCLSSVSICIFATIYFKTAYPNSPRDLVDYRNQLKKYDSDTYEADYTEFLEQRLIDNASINQERNIQKARLSLWARIILVIAALPLVAILVMFVHATFPPI